MIISGGENIYPAEIEQVLAKHSAVRNQENQGDQDDTWGQIPVAFVVVKKLHQLKS